MPHKAEFVPDCDFVRADYGWTTMASDLELGHGRFISNTYNQDNATGLTTNTGTIQIGSGNCATQLIMAGGKTATVTDTLSGTGNWTGGNGVTVAGGAKLAPGASVGTLNNAGGALAVLRRRRKA